jgi:hypothetical protein
MSFTKLLDDNVRRHSNNVALINDGRSRTHAALVTALASLVTPLPGIALTFAIAVLAYILRLVPGALILAILIGLARPD